MCRDLPSYHSKVHLLRCGKPVYLVAGVHPKIVAERLGHGSIQITLDTYSHVMPQLDRAAGELVASPYRSATT